MAVTPHHYSLPLRSIVNQGYSPSMHTPDPVETFTLCLTGDLRVCSPNLSGPHIPPFSGAHLFSSFPPFHQKIHPATHKYHLFTDLYFNCSHQFTMLVWESVFSWLAISKKADLWRHNCKLSDLFYSVTVCPAYTSPGSLILWWLSLPSLLIMPPSLTLPHFLVPFSALIQFLTCTAAEKTVWFSCFLYLLRQSGIWSDFLSQGSF